jgi:hypothetical protein
LRPLFLILLLIPSLSWGTASLPWSTTFNCPDWTQSDGNPSCDDLVTHGEWKCDTDTPSKEELITVSANYSGGGGGKGQRHWEGNGTNDVSGGTRLVFTSAQTEIWIRFYVRFESSYAWTSRIQNKMLFIEAGATDVIFGFNGGDTMSFNTQGGGAPTDHISSASGTGWTTLMGGETGDGLWHFYEAHLIMDTDTTDGVAEMWVDGVQIIDRANVDLGTVVAGFDEIDIGENAHIVSASTCYAVDYDDIAINNTGRIGPIPPLYAPFLP